MSSQAVFTEFMRRVLSGDREAAADLVKRYERAIRLEARTKGVDPRLGRLFDSVDICQSVLASFFEGAAAGRNELSEPAQLAGLLMAMARRKLAFQARRQRAQRRDHRRAEAMPAEDFDPPGAEQTPSAIVSNEEILQKFRQGLSDEERRLTDGRAQGQSWEELAAEMGGTPEAKRKQFHRAASRVVEQLGLDSLLK
jgi:RNA polymerase sigma-70 factor (ECF subfamily)